MSVTPAAQFVSLLEQSKLLNAEQLDAARAELATADAEQLSQLVTSFTERGWLTRWQGQMLLSGRHAFFLGRYKLLDHLGEGGMGSVLKAEQTPLGRLVAIKTLRKDLVDSKELVARFHREIQAAAALNHPNIVAAYDADSVAGRHFLVMEYVEGRDLGAIVKRSGKLPIGAACEYIRQAALGLQHAHEQQMVHRDIKPSNLILSSTGRVKILDMGLARIVQGSGKEQTELTHTGQVVGTPDYISPEQARDTKSADIRSDIYSLGCSLFRLLSGNVPFQGDGAIAKITARLTDDVPLLRGRVPEAPAELEAVVLKMMARDVSERHQTPKDVVQALTPFADATIKAPAPQEIPSQTTGTNQHVAVAPELNDFLNQLAVAAARDAEVDTGTQEMERTEADGHSIDRSAPTQKYDPDAASTDTKMTPEISRAGRKLQEELAARKQADKRRFRVILSVVIAFLVIISGLASWHKAGETHLLIETGEIKLESATLKVDGRPRQLAKTASYEYRGRPGTYRITLVRDGYETVAARLTLTRGESKTFQPEWKPNADTVRNQDLAALQRRVDKVTLKTSLTADDADVILLRDDLHEFRRQSPGTVVAIEAAKLMSNVPWPVDALQQDDIDRYELKAAGHGDATQTPEELVAVCGDSRLKHWGSVKHVAFNANGKTIATAGYSGHVIVWDAQTGELMAAFRTDHVNALTFSRDGQLLAAGSAGSGSWGSITVWNLERNEKIFEQIAHGVGSSGGLYSVDFSPDGLTLVSGGTNAEIYVWDIESGKRLAVLKGHTASVSSVLFSRDASRVVSVSRDGTLRIWDVSTGKTQRTLDGSSILLSPDGRLLVSVTPGTDVIKLLDFPDGREPRILKGHIGKPLAFSPDGKKLAIGDHEKMELLDVETGAVTRSRLNVSSSVSFSPDGKTIAAAGNDGSVQLWDVSTGEDRIKTRGHQGAINAVAVSPNGQQIASASDDSTVKLWNLASGTVLRTLSGHTDNVRAVAFSPDGKFLVTGSNDKTARVWNLTTGKEQLTFARHTNQVSTVAFFQDSATICSGGYDDTVRLWNAVTGEERHMLKMPASVYTLGVSPDQSMLYLGGNGAALQFWDVATATLRRKVAVPYDVSSIVVSPDGETIVTVTGAGTHLRNAATGKELQMLPATIATFSPDGTLMATIEVNGTVELWKMQRKPDSSSAQATVFASPEKSFRLHGGTGAGSINDLTFTPDGRHLVTANANGTIYVLRVKEWSAK